MSDEAYVHRGECWLEKEEYDKAIADFDQAIRITPHDPNLFWRRGCAWGQKKEIETALKDYSESIRLDPACPVTSRPRLRLAGTERARQGHRRLHRGDPARPKYACAYCNRGNAW